MPLRFLLPIVSMDPNSSKTFGEVGGGGGGLMLIYDNDVISFNLSILKSFN